MNAGELALADFLSSDDGLDAWLAADDPVLILTDDMRPAPSPRSPGERHGYTETEAQDFLPDLTVEV